MKSAHRELGTHFLDLFEAEHSAEQSPWYFHLASELKNHFIDTANHPESPELSKIQSVTDLLIQVNLSSELVWRDAMTLSLDGAFSEYSPKSAKGHEFIASLSDKDHLFKELSNNRNWQFESLRKDGDAEIWYSLVFAISEREQFKARVLMDWVKNMSVDDEKRWGVTRAELELFASLNLELQPNVDAIYVKQMMIAGSTSSVRRNPAIYSIQSGSASLYIVGQGKEEKRYTFKDVFPKEINNINKIMQKHSKLIRHGIKNNILPVNYGDVATYISVLGKSIASDETNIKKIFQTGHEYENLCGRITSKGCLLVVNPHGFVSEEGDRVDMELMIGLNIGAKSQWYKDSQNLAAITEKYFEELELPKDNLVSVAHQVFLAVNGSNITYTCLASAGDGYINYNDGRHIEVGVDRHERYSSFISDGMSQERFINAIAIGTLTHEFGHLFKYLDNKLHEKMGNDINVNKFEELKADAVGTILFKKYLEEGKTDISAGEYLEQYILNYLDDILDAPDRAEDRSPTWYAFNGRTIITTLLEVNSIDYVNGKFTILDANLGIETLAELGKKIIANYMDPDFKSQQVGEFVRQQELLSDNNKKLEQFIADLKMHVYRKS